MSHVLPRNVSCWTLLLLCSTVAQDDAPSGSPAAQHCYAQTLYTNQTASMLICAHDRKSWRERKSRERAAQVHATLSNPGSVAACGIKVEVDQIESALRWWPSWLNTTVFPGAFLAGRSLEIGAVIPSEHGYPDIRITAMQVCTDDEMQQALNVSNGDEEGNSDGDLNAGADGEAAGAADTAEEPGKPDCHVREAAGGVRVRWCVETKPFMWIEPRGHKRYVRAQGRLTNLHDTIPVCDISFSLERSDFAQQTWPDWFPTLTEPMEPGNSFVVGGNIPLKEGYPRLELVSFQKCPDV